jgi:hypothetical protein
VLQWSIQPACGRTVGHANEAGDIGLLSEQDMKTPIMNAPILNTPGTNPTDATSTSWSARRGCTTTYASAFATARATRTFASCVHTKVAIVAWHRAYTPAMHHPRRPEEVASH